MDSESGLNTMANIDEMMYSCGVEILHPGGLEKTFEMADDCKINKDSKVLDIGSGKGNTAICLAEKYGCSITGVDMSKDMVDYANSAVEKKGLSQKISFLNHDAQELPFDDGTFDVVFAECSTVLMDKEKAFKEFIRVAKPGGHVGDLEMTWKKDPDKKTIDGAYKLWGGFSTKTFDGWREFYAQMGLTDIKINDFSDSMNNMEKLYIKWLGVRGILKMTWILLINKSLRKGMIEYNKFFKDAKDYIGYGYFVGRRT
ncbi:MAG: class I SAM-dependent methyltransferase [Anaerolineales bacterium]|nr:class I SAM-dependent methyltransferase [Anaerolineales bacterium]